MSDSISTNTNDHRPEPADMPPVEWRGPVSPARWAHFVEQSRRWALRAWPCDCAPSKQAACGDCMGQGRRLRGPLATNAGVTELVEGADILADAVGDVVAREVLDLLPASSRAFVEEMRDGGGAGLVALIARVQQLQADLKAVRDAGDPRTLAEPLYDEQQAKEDAWQAETRMSSAAWRTRCADAERALAECPHAQDPGYAAGELDGALETLAWIAADVGRSTDQRVTAAASRLRNTLGVLAPDVEAVAAALSAIDDEQRAAEADAE